MFGLRKKRDASNPQTRMATVLATGKFNLRKSRRITFRPVRLMRTLFILLTAVLIGIGLWGLWR